MTCLACNKRSVYRLDHLLERLKSDPQNIPCLHCGTLSKSFNDHIGWRGKDPLLFRLSRPIPCNHCDSMIMYKVWDIIPSRRGDNGRSCGECGSLNSLGIFLNALEHARLLLCKNRGEYVGTGDCDNCSAEGIDFFSRDVKYEHNKLGSIAYGYVRCPAVGCGVQIILGMLWNKEMCTSVVGPNKTL